MLNKHTHSEVNLNISSVIPDNQWCSDIHTIPHGVWVTLFAAACRLYDPMLSILVSTHVVQPPITLPFFLLH